MTRELQSHFLNLYALALSDAQIDTKELETLYRIGEEKGVEASEIKAVILHPDKTQFTLPVSLEEKVSYLYDFARLILADGIVDSNERSTLELFCRRFGFEEENIGPIADVLLAAARDNTDLNELLFFINENLH